MEDNFWDQRYKKSFESYGKEPNLFFKEIIDGRKPGKILLPAEGEGRNAVYAAKKGWEIDAFDSSKIARDNALHLAKENEVSINYTLKDFEGFQDKPNHYDLIALIFVHMPASLQKSLFDNLITSLKPDGELMMEVFSLEQLHYGTGGPPNPDLLYTEDALGNLLQQLKIQLLEKKEVHLQEGQYHEGTASVIRVIAQKLFRT